MFNSRRIGRRPSFIEPSTGDIIDRPNETTILSAAKILGQTSSGVKYGVINALTNEEFGTREYDIDGETKREKNKSPINGSSYRGINWKNTTEIL